MRIYWAVRRPRTRAVRCLIRRGGEILLVRHAYGDRRWGFPGGSIKRGEAPAHAATREVREELGLELNGWRELAAVRAALYGRREITWYLTVEAVDDEVHDLSGELSEVSWFSVARLPARRSQEVDRAARAGLLSGSAQ